MNNNYRLGAGFVILLALLCGWMAAARAATYTFDDSGSVPLSCSRTSPGNYQCPATTLSDNDTVVISGTTPATLNFSGDLTLGRASLNSGGAAAALNVVVNGALLFSNTGATLNGGVTANSICADNNNCAGNTFGGNVTAASGNAVLGDASNVAGVLNVAGNLALGRLTVATSGYAGTAVTATGTLSFTNSAATLHGNVSAGGWSCTGSNCAQTVNGNLTVAAGAVTLASGAVVTGTLTATGTGAGVTLDRVTIGTAGNAGSAISTTGTLSFTNSAATIHGNISAGTWSCSGSNCAQTVNGSLTVSTGGVQLASGAVQKGAVTAKGTGGYVILDRVTVGQSGNTGTIIDTVGSVTFTNTGATIHGNVIAGSFAGQGNETVNGSITASNIPGAVFGSGTTVTGCVSAATSTSPAAIQYGSSNTINSTCCRMADNSCYATQNCVSGAASTPAYCSGATITYEKIVVNASGSSAASVWPIMELWVNGTQIGTVSVNSGSARDYEFPAIYPDTIRTIDVVFNNDGMSGTADRNLYVNRVTVRGSTLAPTAPGVVYELPYSAYGVPTQLLAGTTTLYGNGALRFNMSPLVVGNCYAGITGYSSIAAAIAAASAGDAITICPGTYNEALNITKSVGLRSSSTPASAAAATVTIDGGSSPAINLPYNSTATQLFLTGVKLRSTGNAVTASYLNGINTNYSFVLVDMSSTGTALELGNSNPGQVSLVTSTVNSTGGRGLNLGYNAVGRLLLSQVSVTTVNENGISYAGQYNNGSNLHTFNTVQVTTAGSSATGLDFRSGSLYLADVTVNASGVGIYHDAGHASANSFLAVNVRSGAEGIKMLGNLSGAHVFDNIYIRTTGSNTAGMSLSGGQTFNDIDIEANGDAIYLDRTHGKTQTYTKLNLVSTTGAGIRIATSGTQIASSLTFGTATGNIKIAAGGQGIYLADSMAATATLKFDNIDLTSGKDGIYLADNMGGIFSLGTLAPVSIKTTSASASSAWGVYVSRSAALTIKDLTVDSVKGGVYLGSNVTGTVSMQGLVTKPISITANGTSSHALYMGNMGGAATLNWLTLRQPNGYGLEAGSNATIGTLSNFDIASLGAAININSPSVNLTLKDGTASASAASANAINLANQGSCSKTHSISNVIATPGSGGRGIYVACASTLAVTGVCTIGGQHGLYFDSNAGRVTVSGSSMGGYSASGMQLQTTTSGSSVTSNCFTTETDPMAFSKKWVTSTFNQNYWEGAQNKNKYQPDPSGNGVNDQNPRATCHLADTVCSGAPAASLIAHYRFEEASVYNGTSGEVKDIAGYAGGPLNGRILGTPVPTKTSRFPARASNSGTCGYLDLPGPLLGGGKVEIAGLPVSTAAGAQTSVSFWMYWNGVDPVMPIGWRYYELYFASGFGFNTSQSDLWGIANTGLANGWHHVVAVFTNGDVTQNALYIDGVKKTLADMRGGAASPSASNAVVDSTLRIGGRAVDTNYTFTGRIDEVKIFNGAVNQAQVTSLYNEVHDCANTGPIAEWRMDEPWWNGTAREVIDSSPYAQHGVAALSSYGTRASTARDGKVCGRGNFTGSYNYVDVADSAIDRLEGPFTMMAWINMSNTSAYQYIFSNSRDCCGTYRGFELMGRYNGSPPTFAVWFTDGTIGRVTAPSVNLLATNTWAHITGSWDGSALKIYVNGNLAATQSYAGKTMAGPSSFPGTLGAMARNMGSTRGYYDLAGYLDEVKAWDRSLSATEIKAIYDNENIGLSWDGSTRECDNLSALAEWRLDEGFWSSTAKQVKDSINTTTSGPHGTAYGGVQTNINGVICSAGDFKQDSVDGDADYLIMPIPASGLSTKRFSVSMWVNFNTLGNEMVLMHIPNTGTSRSRYFYLSNWQNSPGASHNGLHFGTLNTDGTWGRGYYTDADVFTTGQWYHLVTVVDAEKGRLTAYLNGSVVADISSWTGAIPGTPTEIWLGGTPEGSRFLDGRLDEVVFFNGALTQTQVKNIYSWQNAKKDWNGNTRSCPAVGIPANFNCVEAGADYASGKLYTKLAGKSFAFDVVALKADGTVQSAYATEADRSVKVELIDGSQTTSCSTRTALVTLPNLTFLRTSVATEKGRKTYTVADNAVPSAYKNLRCRITDTTATPGTPIYGCSTDNFAIRPIAPVLASAANAPATTPMNATTPVVKAGANFTISASSATANYTDNLTLDTDKLTAQNPASTSKLAGGVIGALTPSALRTNAGNVNATYSEVGYLFLAPGAYRDDQFTTVDQPNDCISSQATTDYLGDTAVGGKYGCTVGNKTEVVLGRFIPNQLSVTTLSYSLRSGLSCSPASSFNYYDEDFSTNFLLTAHNLSGAVTKNYTSQFARLNPLLWNTFGFVASGQPAGAVLAQGSGSASGAFSNGQASVTQSHKLAVAAPPAAPATASLTVLPVDADGVTLAGSTPATLGSASFRQGRARLMNAQGAELLDLPVSFRLESWGGQTSGWATNTDDNCTPATVNLADGKNLPGTSIFPATRTCVLNNASACPTTRAGRSFSNPAANGKFNLWLKAPGAGNAGYVTVTADVPSYLEYDWSGSKADPSARATFGLRKSGAVLFRRDVFGR